MMARRSVGFWPEKPAGAVALVDGWLFGEGGAPLRVTRRAIRQRDTIIISPIARCANTGMSEGAPRHALQRRLKRVFSVVYASGERAYR
jgi:hypothetical protein